MLNFLLQKKHNECYRERMLHFNVEIEIESRKTTTCLKNFIKFVDAAQIDHIILI